MQAKEALVRQQGVSEAEFAAFYADSKDRCLRALIASGLRPAEAEEALAEGFARAWSHWNKVRAVVAPEAWVVRSARNANVSWWRRRRRESPTADLPVSGHLAETPDRTDLVAAIRRLPPRQRDVVIMRYLLDLDTAQTAVQLGISHGTVASQLHRGLHALRSHLTEPEGINP